MTRWLADTSVAIPLVLVSHDAHGLVNRVVADRTVELAVHAALETYSVLTRLPGDARVLPGDAALLVRERFGPGVVLSKRRWQRLVGELAELGLGGGAVYDALIAMTAVEADAVLLTRDRRAAATYAKVRAAVEMVS